MKTILLLDVDGVLGGFVEAVIESAHKFTDQKFTLADFPEWQVFKRLPPSVEKQVIADLHKPGWCANIPVLEASQQAVREFRKGFKDHLDIYFATSPWHSSPNWVYERHHWLKKHFDAKDDHVIQMAHKHLLNGHLLVDDKVSTVERWQDLHETGTGIIWDTPHNQNDRAPDTIVRTNDWGIVHAQIEHYVNL